MPTHIFSNKDITEKLGVNANQFATKMPRKGTNIFIQGREIDFVNITDQSIRVGLKNNEVFTFWLTKYSLGAK